jgi:hypothetical protein
LGVLGQSETSKTSSGKPRFEVRGHPKFAERLELLRKSNKPQDKRLGQLIDDARQILSERPTAGDNVPRDRWPKDYSELELPCLYKYDLTKHDYRMTYSIIGYPDKRGVFVWIIEYMTHKEYNRRFGYT